MAYYEVTSADMTKLAAAGVSGTRDGNPLAVGDLIGLTQDEVYVFTCNSSKEFYIDGNKTSINFESVGNTVVNLTLSSNNKIATYKTPPAGLPAGTQPWNPWKYVFNIATKASAIPLGWGTHPVNGIQDTDYNFSWSGGNSPYGVIVLRPDGSEHDNKTPTADTSYTLRVETGNPVGDYTVKVTDASNTVINSVITISPVPKPVRYTFTDNDIINLTNKKVTIKINGVPVISGETVVEGDILTATTSDDYQFYIDVYSSINFTNSTTYLDFTLASDRKTATVTMNDVDWLVFNVDTKPPTPATLAGNNVYTATPQIVTEVTKNRFEVITISGQTTFIDYGNYVLSLLQLPFTLDPEFISGDASIMLANHSTGVTSKRVITDVIPFDFGSITIPESFNNILDFDNTTAILNLPYSSSINIDVEYVVGQTIKVEYLIDCYSGKATINIWSSKINDVIQSKEVDLGINIPYANSTFSDTINNSNVDMGGNNRIKKPFIELVKSDAPLANGFFTIPIADEQLLSTQTGFIQVENIDLNSTAIKSEKDDLINILNAGVIIK